MIQTASSYLLEMFFDRDLFHRFNYVQKPLKIKYIKL
jgi:hypothetical protein